MANNILIQKGQCYSHKCLTRYYEIDFIHNRVVHFQYVVGSKIKFGQRKIEEFERLIEDGWIVRDL